MLAISISYRLAYPLAVAQCKVNVLLLTLNVNTDLRSRLSTTFVSWPIKLLCCAGRAEKPEPVKVVLLLWTIGQRRNDMFDAFTWDAAADRQIYQTVVDKFNSFCTPRVNVVAMTHKVLTQKKTRVS